MHVQVQGILEAFEEFPGAIQRLFPDSDERCQVAGERRSRLLTQHIPQLLQQYLPRVEGRLNGDDIVGPFFEPREHRGFRHRRIQASQLIHQPALQRVAGTKHPPLCQAIQGFPVQSPGLDHQREELFVEIVHRLLQRVRHLG